MAGRYTVFSIIEPDGQLTPYDSGSGNTGRHDLEFDLIQQRVEIEPAAPKLNFVELPGTDGTKDITEALGLGVAYADRSLKWTFALRPGQSWEEKKTQVTNALHGLRARITLDRDPGWYYAGRLAVRDYAVDGILKRITVEAICSPYRHSDRAQNTTVHSYSTPITISRGRQRTTLRLMASKPMSIRYDGSVYQIPEGESMLPPLTGSGDINIHATLAQPSGSADTGVLRVEWTEGSF